MKSYFLLLLAILFIASCEKEENLTYPDHILAGQVSGQGIKYFDIRPDTALTFDYPSSGSNNNLDIDNNGSSAK